MRLAGAISEGSGAVNEDGFGHDGVREALVYAVHPRKVLSFGKGSFTHTFDRPSTYPYRCTLHDGMDMKVVVK